MKRIRKSKEQEHLEIVEKKVDIQRKRIEIKKEKQALNEFERRKISIDEQRVLIDKVSELARLMSICTIDEEKTILGSEPMLKKAIGEQERKMIEMKLCELVRKF